MSEMKLDVLVVDDDDVTAEVVTRALKRMEGDVQVVAAVDGQDGLDVLQGKSSRSLRRPYVVLLDLNMPRMNGFEFIEAIRADDKLDDSVIFVLTSSDAEEDRSRAYHEHIAGYMVKSSVGPQFSRLLSMLREFTAAVRLPS